MICPLFINGQCMRLTDKECVFGSPRNDCKMLVEFQKDLKPCDFMREPYLCSDGRVCEMLLHPLDFTHCKAWQKPTMEMIFGREE